MKRLFCILICVAMVCTSLVLDVHAAKTYYEAGFDYEKINSQTEAKIVCYYGLGGDLEIPETLGGLPVTAVADGAVSCQADTQIETLSLPKTLKSFSANAISGNYSLKSISLHEENESFVLCDGALYTANMGKLVLYPVACEAEQLYIPEGVRIVESAAVFGAVNLKRVVFPASLTTISNALTNLPGAFEGCTSLTRVEFPAGISLIGDYAFMGCSSLSDVVIYNSTGKSVTIGMGAFLNCPQLIEVRLYSNIKEVRAEAFGYNNTINPEGMVVTERVEGFTVYAIDQTAGAQYANANGFDLVKMAIKSDFFSTDFCIIGSDAALKDPEAFDQSVLVGGNVSADTQSLCERYFPTATQAALITVDLNQKEGVNTLSDSILYSLPLSATSLSSEEEIYVFFVDESLKVPEYITSCASANFPDAWGDLSGLRIQFETDRVGTFFLCNGAVLPGHVSSGEEIGVGDLTLLAKLLGGWSDPVDLLASDVDGNGAWDVSDLTLLTKVLGGWDEELLPFASSI